MNLEDLIKAEINFLSDFGPIPALITTENETKLYNICELRIITINGEPYIKIEGQTSKEGDINNGKDN